ncbi:glutathione S-transferase N-terminal domain-containing protein [Anaerococcus hydrogenalis]|uniref:glutaredoxin family protein n=1 Tax=Anaerococcus hydrogenalis TaxID=33029 RepID=UPI0029009E3F|nr:glutathione S-transferase N-terminal domain-containing protein [Anaerococcus hydrogenalis]MDU1316720.1 glutathione S-transferase N-terminal domain-containing protein [Anaerococcus hydrogenalis]
MSDYKLFVGTACPHCRKVENFLEENDIKIDIVNINEDRDAMMELIQKGGKRQVPCLFHDGEYLYESNDIIDFLGK